MHHGARRGKLMLAVVAALVTGGGAWGAAAALRPIGAKGLKVRAGTIKSAAREAAYLARQEDCLTAEFGAAELALLRKEVAPIARLQPARVEVSLAPLAAETARLARETIPYLDPGSLDGLALEQLGIRAARLERRLTRRINR
jgi:hypothetical protein